MKSFFHYLAILAVFLVVSWWQTRGLLSTENSPAPYFSLPTLQQPELRFSIKALQGKKTVLYFFAPWCAVCRYSMPNLEKRYRDGSINAVAIALDYQSIAEVEAFTRDLGLSMPVLLGSNNTTSDYRINGFPTYYVVNEELMIISRSVGYSTELGLAVRSW
ncbi:putative heme-binding protein [Pseudoalteromonas luteoviolacea B = ATCC 29581]|nr:putative heme-binding protein [Pseudoalteromonas luteoviolacea B = ATCC 29581]